MYVITKTGQHIPSANANIHTPGIPTLLVSVIFIISGVCDPGIVIELIPSPALIPATASFPPNPLNPAEPSPVVHCMSV